MPFTILDVLYFLTIHPRVLIDDSDPHERSGGKAYTSFGINPSGAIVIVRPDGYVGMVAPFTAVDDIEQYFDSFAAKE